MIKGVIAGIVLTVAVAVCATARSIMNSNTFGGKTRDNIFVEKYKFELISIRKKSILKKDF